MTKKSLIISAALLFALFFSACSRTQPNQNLTPSPSPTAVTEEAPPIDSKKKANYELTATQSGQMALDLLQSSETVETKDYGAAGQFVTSINGLEGNSSYYWAFYLNGKYAEKGASQTTLQKGDIIKFVYEAVAVTK